MKAIKFLIFLSFVMIANFSLAQSKMQAAKTPVKEKAKIDEGEMKTYVMVFLKKGPNRTHPKEEAAKIQEGHMAHLTKMHQEGILLMAGPFMDDEDIKGILVMLADEESQIKDMVEQDPAIKSGRLIAEYHRWYTKSGTVTLP